jgi:putative copper export protein
LIGRAMVDWPVLAVLVALFGLALFIAAIASPRPAPAASTRTLWMILRVLSAAQLALWPLKLLVNTSEMAGVGTGPALALVPEVLRETRFGQVWLVTAPLALLLAVLSWIPRPGGVRAGLMALASAAILLAWAFASHAIDFGTIAVAAYFGHEAAAGVWFGSLAGLWIVGRRESSDATTFETIANQVSRCCGWAVAVLLLSGGYLAYLGLGLSIDVLANSLYGQILLAKLTIAGVTVGIGGYNRYRLVPAAADSPARRYLWRNVGVELILLLGAIGLAALLGNTPPPRHHHLM